MKKLLSAAFVAVVAGLALAETSPEKEFAEAYAAGKPLTAENAFKRLVEKNPSADPLYYYQGARVAEQLRKANGVRDRYAHLVRTDKEWNERVAEAAANICVYGGSVEAYARLAKSDPSSERIYRLGTSQLWKFREQRRNADVLAMADTMLGVYKKQWQVNEICWAVYYMMCDRQPGFSFTTLMQLLKRHPAIANFPNCTSFLTFNRDEVTVPFAVEYVANIAKKPFDNGYFENYLINDGIFNGRRVPDAKKRIELLKKLRALEGMLFDPVNSNTQQAVTYFNVRFRERGAFVEGDLKLPATRTSFAKDTVALFEKLCKLPPKENSRDRIRGTTGNLVDYQWNIRQEIHRLRETYPGFFTPSTLMRYGGAADRDNDDKRYVRVPAILAKNDSFEYRWEALSTIAALGEPKVVYRTLEEHILRNPHNFNRDHVFNMINTIRKDKSSAAERAAFLTKMLKAVGYSRLWDPFAGDGWKKNVWWVGAPEFEPLRKLILAKPQPENPLVKVYVQMAALRRYEPKATQLMNEALKLYTQPLWPKAGEDKVPSDTALMSAIHAKYGDLCHRDGTGRADYDKTMTPRMTTNTGWWYMDRSYEGYRDGNRWADYCLRKVQVGGDWGALGSARLPKGTKEIPAWINLAKASYDNAYYFTDGCCRDRLAPEGKVELVGKFLLAFPATRHNDDWAINLLNYVKPIVEKNKELAAKFPWDAVAKSFVDAPRSRYRTARHLLYVGAYAGRRNEMFHRYMTRLDQEDLITRVNEYTEIVRSRDIVTDWANTTNKIENLYVELMHDRLLPALKQVKNQEAAFISFTGGWEPTERLFSYCNRGDNRKDADLRKWAGEFYEEVARLRSHGAQGCGDPRAFCVVYNHCFRKALKAGDLAGMSRVAAHLGRSWYGWIGHVREMQALCDELSKGEYWEPLYLFANAVETDDGSLSALASRERSKAAPHLPGIYPVPENHPAYPLYVAADELARHNPERAWDLLQRSVPVFEREAIRLPPDFTAWGVERLRMARGDKDALLLKARTIASTLLANEAKLTPELAAAMMLVKAESYRDQQNFEAAKLEYQSIRNNPKYNATPSGRKAMFRSVGLMIDMGNASAAESTLEYWLSQPDTEVQAEAHYFLARIAFERKDYEETIKQLRETFALDFTHTEARFLHGKWKLATNSEVDDTDVMIGTLEDRTVIRPGQQLTITVQDRNLSVAGGGASIPVIVTTAPGNDVERIFLYPSARDPNLFKGIIDVKLGVPVHSNLFLEVSGRDTASYVIEPAFLKARGLPINKGKVLRVVDDAKLEIENEDLRPGNPLYVTLEDKDRSLGGPADTVGVTVKTSSGDTLSGFELKEVAPHTGKFRGEIPTSLPPPRAFASDTAVGFNPGDAINSNKKTPWRSLDDGVPGKWIEVDTMASHLVREAKVDVKNAGEIREVALVGRLGTETIRLGSLPEEPVEKRLGLKLRWENHRGIRRGEDSIRAHFSALHARDYRLQNVTNGVSFTPAAQKRGQWVPQNLWWAGAFVAPKDVSYVQFKIVAKKTVGDTFRNLWIAVALDGESVFQGQGPTLHGRLVSMDVAPGAHQLEVFASGGKLEDGFDLVLDDNGEEKPFPMDWFSAAKHPELNDFLKSRAVVSRNKDGSGFTAKFSRPMRLRSLRWEFVKRTTPDVIVDKLYVTDAKGKQVIPVESDFSDAQQNDNLEVAPGDTIAVQYTDEITNSGEKRVLEKTIRSSFNNARIGFFFEELVRKGRDSGLHCREAFRFRAGDNLLVGVFDPDMDSTAGADRITVKVVASSGESKVIKLVEQEKDYAEFRRWRTDGDLERRTGVHSGLFLGLLRTIDADKAKAMTNGTAKAALPVKAGEALTLNYMDRENTNPGVPFQRTAKVSCTKLGKPQIQLFHTRKGREVDTSPQARARLAKIRRRPGNEQVKALYRDVFIAVPMTKRLCNSTNAINVNVAAPIPVRIVDPTRACHAASKIMLEAVSRSEVLKARAEGREPEKVTIPLYLGAQLRGFRLKAGAESPKEAQRNGSFNGILELCLGAIDPERIVAEDAVPQLQVTGSDVVLLTVLDEKGKPMMKRKLRFVSNGALQLMDSTWSADRRSAHVGERFYVSVDDPDCDATPDPDRVTVRAQSLTGGPTNDFELVETMPHSGVFSGTYPAAKYGDQIVFSYCDARTLPGTRPGRTLCVTGEVFSGSDGSVRLFSKRFRDGDAAVLVQFRLAECLFEQAKEHRKLKQQARSQEAIGKGKYILEEALKNYPDSKHVVQGEYLLANLYQELATEQKDAGNKAKATPLYTEALARFSSILSAWPDSEYGAKAQFHKALCLEMLGDYPRASEEYVKMTYLYPESELVGDATIRLATYYYKHEKRYDIAGRIYENFQKRFPTHEKAPRTLFMSGSCYVKQAETIQKKYEEETKRTQLCKGASDLYLSAAKSFAGVAEKYRESAPPEMRAQALYWTGDAYLRRNDYKNSYLFLKRTVFEYPETEWARRARGLLLQESQAFDGLERQ